MYSEPFLDYRGDITFVFGVSLLLPLFFAMSLLVRWRAWLGLVAVVVFFATCVSMLAHNGSSESGGTGFFEAWLA